jgi:recombinational DNA repair protein RecR
MNTKKIGLNNTENVIYATLKLRGFYLVTQEQQNKIDYYVMHSELNLMYALNMGSKAINDLLKKRCKKNIIQPNLLLNTNIVKQKYLTEDYINAFDFFRFKIKLPNTEN